MVASLNTLIPARDAGEQQVHFLRKAIDLNSGAAITIGKIPAGASVVGGGVHIKTAFDATTTKTLDIGFVGATTDVDAYATALTLAAVGYIVLDELGSTTNIQGTVEHTVTATLNLAGASTTGVADIIIQYVTNNP